MMGLLSLRPPAARLRIAPRRTGESSPTLPSRAWTRARAPRPAPAARAPLAAVAVVTAALIGAAAAGGCGRCGSSSDDRGAARDDRAAAVDRRGIRAPGPDNAAVGSEPPAVPSYVLRPRERLTREEAVSMQVENARRAVAAGDLALAFQLCEEIIASDGSNQDALAVCVAAGCRLREADKARAYAALLDGDRRAAAARECAEAGVEL